METPNRSTPPPTAPAEDVARIVEHLFRHEAGKMVATLTRIFGLEHWSLAEDVVQEALARALQTWPFYGVPRNPSAWIMRAARNRALDVVRREKVFRDKEAEIVRVMERPPTAPEAGVFAEDQLADDRLGMMFVCCHPMLAPEAQVALALNTLCGFSITEISRAFLTTEAAIAKRLTRAKQRLRQARIPFAIPSGAELAQRLESVLRSLYLLFNEGYKASGGEKLVREDVCQEAVRLVELLARHPVGNRPPTHALLALMLLNAARLPSRVDEEGNLLRLQEQDRTRWDQGQIARGLAHLAQSAAGDDLTEYHLQAAIAACHCVAPDYAATDWSRILVLYDHLVRFDPSPIVALNRAIVIARLHGPQAALAEVAAIPGRAKLESYYLFHAALGEFEAQRDAPRAAAGHFRRSLALAETQSQYKVSGYQGSVRQQMPRNRGRSLTRSY